MKKPLAILSAAIIHLTQLPTSVAVADSVVFSPAKGSQDAQQRTPYKIEALASSTSMNGSTQSSQMGLNFETLPSLELIAPYRNDVTDGITTTRMGVAMADRAHLRIASDHATKNPKAFVNAGVELISPLAIGVNRKLKDAFVHESVRFLSAGFNAYANSQLDTQMLGASLDLVSVAVNGEVQVLPRVLVDACSSFSLGAVAGSNIVLGERASVLSTRARASACLGVALKNWGRLGYRVQWEGFAIPSSDQLMAGQILQHEVSVSKIAGTPLFLNYKNQREDQLIRSGSEVPATREQSEVITHTVGLGISL